MHDAAPGAEPQELAAAAAPGRWARLKLPLALVLLTALAYANAAPKVLLYDDHMIISQGVGLERLDQIPGLFFKHARASAREHSRLYRPVAMSTLVIERVLHGGHARIYHVTTIIMHLGCTLLLFGVLMAFGASRRTAFVAALVFGVHPIHTEAVDQAFNRSEILATIGVLGGLWWLWRFLPRRRLLAIGGAGGIYFVALLCRESAVTLPALAVLAFAVLRPAGSLRAEVRRLAPLALLLVPLAGYLWLRQQALGEPGGGIGRSLTDGLASPGGVSARLALLATTLRDYVRMLAWPWPLRLTCHDYTVRLVWLAIAVHAGLLAAAVALVRRASWVTFAIAFFYVAILPSSKLFSDPATLAERFVYLPSAGACFALAAGLGTLERRHGARPVLLAAVAFAGAFMPLTLLRNLDFHSKHALWEAEYAATDRDWQVLLNLSEALLPMGHNDRVLAICRRGREVAPWNPGFRANAGVAYINVNRLDDAEREFRAAVAMAQRPEDYANLARLMAMTQRLSEAEAAYREGIRRMINPSTRYALTGEMLLRCRKDAARAATAFEAALRLEPKLRSARDGLNAARRLAVDLEREAAAERAAQPGAGPASAPGPKPGGVAPPPQH
ncbi:MAG TPA: hypothetical protein VGQ83_16070 [Polyangia bacterium]